MLHLLVWPLLPFPQRSTLAFTFNLVLAEETLVNHPVDIPVPQHVSSPRAEPSAQVEIHPHQGPSHPLLKQRYQPHQRWTLQSNQRLQVLQGFNPLLARQKPQP
jgi:hypothetical protein